MDALTGFQIARLPKIIFGPGTLPQAAIEARGFGSRVLLVTGGASLEAGGHLATLTAAMDQQGLHWERTTVAGEPSPDLVDAAVARFKEGDFHSVLAVGGGSALDAGKAIAGLLPSGRSVYDHLEGVGPQLPYQGPATPLIAVPTTAGTGSEATKNAVLSHQGIDGFKKSFRDDRLIAAVAVVDPDLLASCPRPLLAANGMDAFTQLLESFVSTRSNPLTDALALSGLTAFRDGFFAAWEGSGRTVAAAGRARLAYASLLSGICLAQTGLGVVHGLASPMGGFFPIPHGVVCGTLLAEATAVNIAALQDRAPDSPALEKYGRVGALLARRNLDAHQGCQHLVTTLRDWVTLLELAPIGRHGVTREDLPRIVAASRGSSMKTNPLPLTDAEITSILERRLYRESR